MRLLETLAGVTALLGGVAAQLPRLPVPSSCSGVPKMRYTYSVAAGWQVTKMAGNLRQVRTIVFDPLGNMLVAEAGKGISAHSFGPDGCINSSSTIIPITALNHGLSLTPDGKTIYASSVTTVFSFSYDPATMKASNQKTVITGMDRGIHSTRTVLVVPQNPNMVLVQVGSNSNLDMQSAQPSVGRSIIKIFDMSKVPASGYNYKTAGEVVAYGLRNEIGFITDPNGGLWGVENSGDVSGASHLPLARRRLTDPGLYPHYQRSPYRYPQGQPSREAQLP